MTLLSTESMKVQPEKCSRRPMSKHAYIYRAHREKREGENKALSGEEDAGHFRLLAV